MQELFFGLMMKPDRKDELRDAAISILARKGARGLSHHKVDDKVGVARGSTSYYYRTRLALLEAVMERVAELDFQHISAVVSAQTDAIAATAQIVHQWLTDSDLERTRARHELFLIASRESTIAKRIAQGREMMMSYVTQGIKNIAPTIEEERAEEVASMAIWVIDGLMFTVVRENSPAPSEAQIKATLKAILGLSLSKSSTDQE